MILAHPDNHANASLLPELQKLIKEASENKIILALESKEFLKPIKLINAYGIQIKVNSENIVGIENPKCINDDEDLAILLKRSMLPVINLREAGHITCCNLRD